jgi:hypothetical protein
MSSMVIYHCQGKQSCGPGKEIRTNSTAVPISEASLEGSYIPTRTKAHVLTYGFDSICPAVQEAPFKVNLFYFFF